MIKFKSPVNTISDGGAPIHLDDFLDIQDTQARYGITNLESIQLGNNGIIVQGVEVTGVGPYNISSGYVYLDGDLRLMPSTNIAALNGYIVADTDLVESRVFFDGNNNPIKVTKRAKWQAGSPAMGFDGISIAILTVSGSAGNDFLLANYTRGIPIRGIIMWNNNTYIPLGFAVCDGSFGTPNLVGKFVRAGATAGGTGGSGSFTIGTANLPSHSHTITNEPIHQHGIVNDGDHNHALLVVLGGAADRNHAITLEPTGGGDEGYMNITPGTDPEDGYPLVFNGGIHNHSGVTGVGGAHDHGGSTGSVGSGTAINFVPTYHELIFIQRIA